METTYINEFITMAKLSNYTSAADALYISQSTLYKHIKALETEIGEPLFERDGRQVIISKYGQRFIPYARQILDAVAQYKKEVDEERQEAASVLRIASQYRIMELVRDFHRDHKKYMIDLVNGGSTEELIEKGDCELAFFCDLKDPEKKYESIPYVEDSLAVILYPSHPLAKRSSIRPEELKREDFILLPSLPDRDAMAMSVCQKAGFTPKVIMTAEPGSEVARLVNQGFGVSLLYKNLISRLLKKEVVAVDLDPKVTFSVSLCWKKNVTLSAGAREFVEFVKGRNQY